MRKHASLGALFVLATWFSSCTYASNGYLWSVGSAASANQVRWTPDPKRGSASSTMSGGRRGSAVAACALEGDRSSGYLDPAITLLVPDGDAVLTTEAQPTLAWYLKSNQAIDMKFVLHHPEHADPVYTQELKSAAGLVEISLPAAAALEVGVPYRWTVFVNCESSDSFVYTRSFVERIEAPSELDTITSSLDRAAFYASQGIWYDALNLLIGTYRQGAQADTLVELRSLLQQINTEIPVEVSLAVEP